MIEKKINFNLEEFSTEIENDKNNWTPAKSAIEAINSCYYTLLSIGDLMGEKWLSEDELEKLVFDSFFDEIREGKLRGEELEKEFFASALGNDQELSKQACDFGLIGISSVACAYAADVIISSRDNNSGNIIGFYLTKAHYYAGIARATITSKVEKHTLVSEKMKDLALQRHNKARQKQEISEREIKRIWHSKNWATYTECAEHIFKQGMFDLSYRKIYQLVSKK